MRASAFVSCACAVAFVGAFGRRACAAPRAPAPEAYVTTAAVPAGSSSSAAFGGGVAAPADDAPPPALPRPHGLVLESSAGVLGFSGQFRHVSPPAYVMRGQLGYEVLRALMVFGGADVALTDTSEAQSPSQERAFPIWGFDGGVRATVHATPRVAAFVQVFAGALSAVVPHGALADLGFRRAENLGLELGSRLGLEWYQVDRHMALSVQSGARYAQGFSRVSGGAVPLMWDGALALRYAF